MKLNYQESRAFIHSISVMGSRLGLERMTQLLERMGNPQDKLRYVHVAGTNGKGSTCTMLSHILRQAGYKVGLNISPFVLDFRERFQINNQMITEDELADITSFVYEHWQAMDAQGEAPSEFEVVTAIAFEYFYRNQCDIVVLEVGVGGRLDATNVIKAPLVSVITSVSVDHVDALGTAIEAIAYEKAGIIKKGGVTVSYPRQDPDALAVLMERCAAMENQLVIPHGWDIHDTGIFGSDVTIDGLEFHIPLAGTHQVYNAAGVVAAARVLSKKGLPLTDEDIINGIQATAFPSRLEVLSQTPMVLMDGAHNLSGAQALGDMLDNLSKRKVHAVIGIMEDKDVDGFIHVIASRCDSIITTSIPSMERFIPPAKLAEKAKKDCQDVMVETSPINAYHMALERCEPDDVLLVCGSFYLASDLRRHILELSA